MVTRHKRRNFFIKKDFQGKLILGYFLFVIGGCLFFMILLGAFSADTLTISYNNNDLQLGQTPVILLKEILAAQWIFIISGSVFIIIAAMLITHRIAGPMFRFEKSLDSMLKNNLNDTIHLRTKDEGKELAKKINDFNQSLSITLKNLSGHSDAITALLERANANSSNVSAEEMEELKSVLWSVQENNKKIQTICKSYTLKDV